MATGTLARRQSGPLKEFRLPDETRGARTVDDGAPFKVIKIELPREPVALKDGPARREILAPESGTARALSQAEFEAERARKFLDYKKKHGLD
jgi:hypothetical protein